MPGLAALLAAAVVPGCAVVPKSRLDEATRVTQSLRAENTQLRDQVLGLRSANDDLSERALADARKLAAIEQANERLESSVQGYIDEREDLVDKFEQFRRLAHSAGDTKTSAIPGAKLRALAAAHPGTTFDEAAGAISVVGDALFLPGTDRLRPEASRWLDDCAAALSGDGAKGPSLRISAPAADPAVRLASTDAAAPKASNSLSLARATRLRDALAGRTGGDTSRIVVARSSSATGKIEIVVGDRPAPQLAPNR